jgi:hypothetical protein
MDNPTISLAVRSIVQELQWIIPGIRVAVVSDPNEPLTSHATWGAFGVVRFQRSDPRNDPLHVLEWFCGADAWLIVDTTLLAEALKRIATELRSPCFSLSSSTCRAGALGWDELTRQIARSFELGLNQSAAVAFRNPIDPRRQHRSLTVDAALQLLGSALSPQTDPHSPQLDIVPVPDRFPDKAPLPRAA